MSSDPVTPDRLQGVHRLRERLRANPATSLVYRVVVTLVALAVIAAGVAMLVLPGPGVAVILVGLAILGSEFPWAKRLVHRVLELLRGWRDRILTWWRSRRG